MIRGRQLRQRKPRRGKSLSREESQIKYVSSLESLRLFHDFLRADPFDRFIIAHAEIVEKCKQNAGGGKDKEEFPVETFNVA